MTQDRKRTLKRIEVQLQEWGAAAERLRAKVDEKVAEAKKEYYERLEELRDEIERQVKKWDSRVAGIKAEAGEAAREAETVLRDLRAKVETELRAWEPEIEEARQKALKEQLTRFKEAGGAAWEDVRLGLGKAWEELKPALHRAIGKFR
jgi:chromosome segregation ATPase